jgi:hypothetical protein
MEIHMRETSSLINAFKVTFHLCKHDRIDTRDELLHKETNSRVYKQTGCHLKRGAVENTNVPREDHTNCISMVSH